MLKKNVKYVDFNGVEREEECYFNLSRIEVFNLEELSNEKLSDKVKRITQVDPETGEPSPENRKEIIKLFEMIILKAYGKKSADGRSFIKNDAETELFKQSEAYGEIYLEIMSDVEAATTFLSAVLPKQETITKFNQVQEVK